MWIMTTDAFISAVELREDPNMLMVRARSGKDLKRLFPDCKIEQTPRADYPFRIVLPRHEFATVVAKCVERIDYDNFKDAVPEKPRHDAYLQCWIAMRDWQDKLQRAAWFRRAKRSRKNSTNIGDVFGV